MSDADSLRRSPDSPRSQKKAASSRTKSAVRAKSGCYTCRIRRKKCDERPNAEGKCETCVRLRLQCLGFGAKRPEWMRENNNVVELRDKIKTFLAAQGMIKGHSGTPRPADREPSILVLQEDSSSGTLSPPRRTMSVSPNERPSGLMTSYVRDGRYPTSIPEYTYPPLTQQSLSANMSTMPRNGPLTGANPDLMLPPYRSSSSSHLTHPHDNLVTNNSAAPDWNATHRAPIQAHGQTQSNYATAAPVTFPNIASSFSPLYQANIMEEDESIQQSHLSQNESDYTLTISASNYFAPLAPKQTPFEYYMNHVPRKQYILVDRSVDYILQDLGLKSRSAHRAMELLACVHQQRTRQGPQALLWEPSSPTYEPYQMTKEALNMALVSGPLQEGDAMAGLHSVSSFLFSGGRGEWDFFLNVACQWVDQKLKTSEWLYERDNHARFLIRTTMWFEVIASVTQCRRPRFMAEYERLFGGGAYIEEGMSSSFSMMDGMGCDNDTFLAIAKTSELAWWKDNQVASGSLSAPELVQRGHAIEQLYLQRRAPSPPLHPPAAPLGVDDSLDTPRRLTADIFRAAARVYLHSIVSGEHPRCKEIAHSVHDTIAALQRVPKGTAVERSVVRSVVFPICICGCLAENAEQQRILRELLLGQRSESVGNCLEVAKLLDIVWARRRAGQPAHWREVMMEIGKGAEMLLLV